MSLKAFHIVFVTVSILLALLVTVWSYRAGQDGAGATYYAMAALSLAGACGMAVYGTWFLRKTEGMSLL